jgi:hypothetical protein
MEPGIEKEITELSPSVFSSFLEKYFLHHFLWLDRGKKKNYKNKNIRIKLTITKSNIC